MSCTETKDLFVVSDIHGHASELFAALDAAGFDSRNPRHLLISFVDHDSRATESRAVYRYLRTLQNKVLLRGNHENILADIIARGYLRPVDLRNGIERTVTAFFGRNCLDCDGRLYADPADTEEILQFIDSTYDYFETAHYRFVHGWVPLLQDEEGYFSPHDGWQAATREEWRRATWTKWHEAYREGGLLPQDKILVCGHRTVLYGTLFDSTRETYDFSPFYGNGMIAIDAQTVTSRQVNVLVLPNEPMLPSATHRMKLAQEPFDAIVKGTKRVEMRLWDEKRRAVKPHDRICFSCGQQTCEVKVLGVHAYPDFSALTDEFDPDELGFPHLTREAICAYVRQFYSEEQIAQHGAVALRIKPI